jgi:hypothetical protein
MQRLSGNLGDRIPDGDLDGADGDRALAVAPDFSRCIITARILPGSKFSCD